MTKSNNYGGKRAGAGRKRKHAPTVTYSVDITPAQAAALKEWGGGDISAGLRWLAEIAMVLVKRKEYTTPIARP